MTAVNAKPGTARFTPSRWLPCFAALALLAAPVPALWAQVTPQAASVNESLDPPGSIARLSLMEGAVSFATGDAGSENAWRQAQLNRPLTAGDRLWTGEQSRTELHIGSTAVRLNGQTSLDFLALDDNTTQLRLAQGTVRLRVRQLFEGQRLEINTPNLAFAISQPGDYRIDANPASNTTRVVAQSGAGVLYGDSGAPIDLGNQQQGNFTGTNLTPAAPGPSVLDSFDNWAMARDQREDQSVSARYVPRETVGYQQLDNYGDWSQDPGYGAVWLPRAVPANWAPYRAGHWSWIAPWGWTWVDDAPWGFAPFHYGRWAQIGPRWAWVPGRLQPRPVYAPALVAFVGGNSGGATWSISLASGGPPRPAVGWFPLAPGEAFRPAYRTSPRYVTRVNNNIVVNNTVNITNTTNVYRYQRLPAAVTAASTSDFASGRAGRSSLQAVNASDLGRARVVNAAAGREALPQRPERRIARAAPAALPPATAATRPVVDSRNDRNDRREDGRDGRDARNGRVDRPQPAPQASAAPPPAVAAAPAAPALQTQPREREGRQDREGRDRDARREQAARPLAAPLAQPGPSPVPAAAAAPVAERVAEEQARRAAQRGQDQQAQAQQQQRAQRDQERQQRLQQQRQQESARREAADQAQAERKAQAEQRAQQAQDRTQERNQQRQAHEQAQRQQQEQRQQRAQASEERQQSRKAEAAALREAREARGEGQAPPSRQQ